MTTIWIIGLAAALAGFVFLSKMWRNEPQKAKKGEKAEIIRQLLALSDLESGKSPTATPQRSPTLDPSQGREPGKIHPKRSAKISQPIRLNK